MSLPDAVLFRHRGRLHSSRTIGKFIMRLGIAVFVAGVIFASIPASAQSVTPDCAGAWGRYSAAPSPKAFANGTKQGCGWQIKNDNYRDIATIRAQALRQCAGYAGLTGGCRIIAQSQ